MKQEGKLTRRAFLQGTAALGAMAALSGCASQEALKPSPAGEAGVASGEVEVRHAWCQMCGPARTHCSTLCYIKDGRWTNVEGNPEAGNNWGRGSRSLCAKGNAAMAVLYAPGRILYPMKRTGEKGEGKFERCSWDEAMVLSLVSCLSRRSSTGQSHMACSLLSSTQFLVRWDVVF